VARAEPGIEIDHEAITQAESLPNERKSRRVQWLVFTSKTCVPCEQAKRDYVPRLQPVGWTFSDTDESSHFLYRDVDEFPEQMRLHRVTQLPTYVLLVDGNQLKRHEAYPGWQVLANEFITATAILPPSTGGLFGPVKIGTIPRSMITSITSRLGKAGDITRKDVEYTEQFGDSCSVTVPDNCVGKWSAGRYEFTPNITIHASGWDQECNAVVLSDDRVLFELPSMIDCYLGIEDGQSHAAYDHDVSSTPRSPQWPAVRRHHLEKHPKCEACGTGEHIEVHHVIPFHIDQSKELDPDNLITLCRKHHGQYGHPGGWSRSNPNVREDVQRLHRNISGDDWKTKP
jgi:hypothetical protein